jgi:hypothetical protein
VLRLAQEDPRLAAFFGSHPDHDSDEDDDEEEQASAFSEKVEQALAQLRCTPANVLSQSALQSGMLHKEGKLNRQFKRRFFVLWRDPGANTEAEQTTEGDASSVEAVEEPMHLLYYSDETSLPKGSIILAPGSFTVGVPKRARRSATHCLRIDGTRPAAPGEDGAGAPFKLVIADDDVDVIREWRVALATRGGMVAETPAADSVDVDQVRPYCMGHVHA